MNTEPKQLPRRQSKSYIFLEFIARLIAVIGVATLILALTVAIKGTEIEFIPHEQIYTYTIALGIAGVAMLAQYQLFMLLIDISNNTAYSNQLLEALVLKGTK